MSILKGFETIKIITSEYTNETEIIALTQNNEFEYMKSMMEAASSVLRYE